MNKIKIAKAKKGISPYVSWILIMAFVVVLSAFMYSFMKEYTENTTQDVKKQVYNTDECRSVSLNILDACVGGSVLNITLQNTNYVRIDKIDFRLYDKRNKPIATNLTNITMNPNRIKYISHLIGTADVGMVEVIPGVYKDNIEIICAERKAQRKVTVCS